MRELFSVGERGGYLSYSRNTYKNTETNLKQNGKLSRKFTEFKGNRQGHVRASGNFKAYINPCLTSLNSSQLGFNIGPICTTAVCVADDTYVQSGSVRGLQGALDIVSHYGKRYQVNFNAGKTKIVVTGSKIDMQYYKDTKPWHLNGVTIPVVENNEHLGILVSGTAEEEKNVDENIQKCRNSLFALLGPVYSYKCLLPPLVQVHLWRVYNLPVLLSGLSALPVRPANMKPLEIFHHKVLRGCLKLSQSSPKPALFFILGELPIEGRLHMNTLSLFHNIWECPDTTAHQIVKYILKMSGSSSTTWSNHIRLLCLKYGLPDPLYLMEKEAAWEKEKWKCLVRTQITIHYERKLRLEASSNSKLSYLNVQLQGLSGGSHPAVQNINSTQDSKKLRAHLKFLCGDFFCGERKAIDTPGSDPKCLLCLAPVESPEHILVLCKATSEIRQRLFPELVNVVSDVQPACGILVTNSFTSSELTQFILDCTSLNLNDSLRIPMHNPGIGQIFRLSRDWCFAVSNSRSRLLAAQKKNKKSCNLAV